MNNPNDMSKENSIFIGEGVVFSGSIKAPNQAIISGKFDGELEARDVLIGTSGVVTGKTKLHQLRNGHAVVFGNLRQAQHIELARLYFLFDVKHQAHESIL